MLGALNNEQIDTLLQRNNVGRIGCTDGTKVYVVPITYAFDGKNIICHTRAGMKSEFMQKHSRVCFEVDEMNTLSDWQSAILWGEFVEIHDEAKRIKAMQFFIRSVLHTEISETAKIDISSKDLHPHEPGDKPAAIVFKIVISEKSGRFESKNK